MNDTEKSIIEELRAVSEKQKDVIEMLNSKVQKYEKIIGMNEISDEYKDRLFKFIFGNPENRQWTLELYNAVNRTDYTDPEAIQFNTIGQFLYMKMRNDASFIIYFEMNLWEHQSTYNPNMPMRFLRYGTRLYEKYIATADYYEYSSTIQPIPKPVCVCFYNGMREQPEKKILKLSDAYEGEGDIEVKVKMLNINYGKNRKLMEACKPLEEYAWLVNEIRNNRITGMELDRAVDEAVRKMPKDYVIAKFITANRAEVKTMLFLEYDEKKIREYDRRDGRIEGRKEGRKEINDLHALLLSEGKIDVLKRAVADPEYQEKLLKEYFPDRVSETE